MKFHKWVTAQGGPTRLAARLSLDSMAVRQWLNRKTTPKALHMQKLVRMGRGAFSYDDIINETRKRKGGRK